MEHQSQSGRHADLVHVAAIVVMGLLAGLFYAFDVAVMPGLTAADDRTLVDAMQRMIDLPAFPLTLLAALVLLVVVLVQARRSGSRAAVAWVGAALAAYVLMALITFAVHFPLNDDLKQAGDPAQIRDLAAVRDDFAGPWAVWNVVRTLALTVSLGCLTWALVLRSQITR